MNRREFIRLSSGTLAASYLSPLASGHADTLTERLRVSAGRMVHVGPEQDGESQVELKRSWAGGFCRLQLINHGKRKVRIREVVVCEASHELPGETGLYGESFQMLSQTSGTLSHPVD